MTASNSRRLLVLLAVLLPRAARAEPPAVPPTEEQVEAARVLYKDARELHKQGRTKEALDKALEAYRVAPTPVTALEAGELLVETGRLVDARDIVRSVALMPVSPRESDKGREARAQAAALAGQLDMRIPKIAFADRPPAVQVLLDGKPVTSTDPTAWQGVDPGAHVLVVRADDRPCTTVNLALSEGEERTIDLHDAAAACRPPPAPAPAPPPVAAPVSPPASVPAPPLAPSAAPAPSANPWHLTGAFLAGAGVAAVGVGGAVALVAKGQYDSVGSNCIGDRCDQSGYDTRNQARSQADAATVMMAVGAAAVVVGAVLWFVEPARDVQVGLGPGGVVLRVVR